MSEQLHKGTNRFGVDVRYFEIKLRLLIRDLDNYQPDELRRVFERLADATGAEPERKAEPVAWMMPVPYSAFITANHAVKAEWEKHDVLIPLYTAPQPSASAWIRVSERLPKSGQQVLACYKNHQGNSCVVRAQWLKAKTEEAGIGNVLYEYDEETDNYYFPEGWYELMDNHDECSHIKVCEGDITHWQMLPAAPKGKSCDEQP